MFPLPPGASEDSSSPGGANTLHSDCQAVHFRPVLSAPPVTPLLASCWGGGWGLGTSSAGQGALVRGGWGAVTASWRGPWNLLVKASVHLEPERSRLCFGNVRFTQRREGWLRKTFCACLFRNINPGRFLFWSCCHDRLDVGLWAPNPLIILQDTHQELSLLKTFPTPL